MKNPTFSNRLSALIEENRAAERAYSQVVQSIENKQFGQLLDNCVEERIRFEEELEAAIGNSDFNGNSVLRSEGEAHPSWLHMHEIFPTSNDAAMLNEAIQGEERTIRMYEAVISDPELPDNSASVLRNHLRSLLASKEAMEALRKNAQPKV